MRTAFSEVPQNFFYLQMLLNPFEEKLDLPPAVIKFSDHYWTDS